MLRVISFFHGAAPGDLCDFQSRRFTVEDIDQLQSIVRDQPCRPVKQPGQMRCDPTFRVPERRPIAQANQSEELIQFTVPIHCQTPVTQIGKSERLLNNDWREVDPQENLLSPDGCYSLGETSRSWIS